MATLLEFMNLHTLAQDILAGGVGSGCNPDAGVCGRKPGKKVYNPGGKKVAGFFVKGSAMAAIYSHLAEKHGEWQPISDLAKMVEGKADIKGRVQALKAIGKETGHWYVEKSGDQVRMFLSTGKEATETKEQQKSNEEAAVKLAEKYYELQKQYGNSSVPSSKAAALFKDYYAGKDVTDFQASKFGSAVESWTESIYEPGAQAWRQVAVDYYGRSQNDEYADHSDKLDTNALKNRADEIKNAALAIKNYSAAYAQKEGITTVYRGLKGEAAKEITDRIKAGASQVSIPFNSLSSWTTKEMTAGGAYDVVLKMKIDPENVWAVYKASPNLFSSYYIEREVVVGHRHPTESFSRESIQIRASVGSKGNAIVLIKNSPDNDPIDADWLHNKYAIQSGGVGSGRHPGYGKQGTLFNKVRKLANSHGMKYLKTYTHEGMGNNPTVKEHVFEGKKSQLSYRDDHSWTHKGAGQGYKDAIIEGDHGLGSLSKHLDKYFDVRIRAGGPGSGCNPAAGHCGRPAGKADPLSKLKPAKGSYTKLGQKYARQAKKKMKQQGITPKVTKSAKGVLNPQEKLKTKVLPSSKEQQPFLPQEKVVLKEDIYRGSKRSPAGEEAVVVNALPKIANQEQLYSVRLRNGHLDYLSHSQIARPAQLKLPDAKPALSPLEGSKVKQSWVMTDGTRYTEYYPSTKGTEEGKTGPRDPLDTPHPLKGTFDNVIDDVYVGPRITSIFNAQAKSGEEGAGTTVFVHRYQDSRTVNVQEARTGKYNWQSALLREYKFEGGKGAKQALVRAMTFTKARYGISLKLPKMVW